MEKKKCLECGKTFTPATVRAVFDTDYCRVKWNRKQKKAEVEKPKKSKSKTTPKKKSPVKKKSAIKVTKGKLVKTKDNKVKFKKDPKGNIKLMDIKGYKIDTEIIPDFVACVDLANPDIKVKSAKVIKTGDKREGEIVVQYDARPPIDDRNRIPYTFNQFLTMAKNGGWLEEYKDLPEFKKLNSNQQAMISSKIKK